MTVARKNLTGLEGLPDEVGEVLLGVVVAELRVDVAEPDKDFLVGKAVERTSETVEASSK